MLDLIDFPDSTHYAPIPTNKRIKKERDLIDFPDSTHYAPIPTNKRIKKERLKSNLTTFQI